MCLDVLYFHVWYMHIHANMNLQVSYICMYLIVSACMWNQIWTCIHAHMIWYSSSFLSVSACISAQDTVIYDLIWNSYLLVYDCTCLSLLVYSAVYAGINWAMFAAAAAAQPLRYVRSAAAARSPRGQSIRRQIAIFIWTRSAGMDSTITAAAGGKRCWALKCLGAPGCQWFTR